MRSNPNSPEQRQHINLSQYAYDVVRNDSINFLGGINISGFINIIIENSKDESFDDLALIEEERILAELSEYSKSSSRFSATESELKAIRKIAAAHKNHILNSFKKYPKDKTLKIRLNNKSHNELYPENTEWYGTKYGISQGEYIKILVENYSRKTYYERECIIYKDRIEELHKNLSSIESEKRILSVAMKDGRKFNCKLYKLSEEHETHYHYLVGLFAKEKTSDYIIASFRLSRISEIKPHSRSFGSGKVTQNEKKRIESRIKNSSIPYLVGEPTEYVIKLSPLGMIMYDYNYSRRPVYEDIEDNHDGTFTMIIKATERQIKNYFFAFGKEALILSPDNMKEWMVQKYTDATNYYSFLQTD